MLSLIPRGASRRIIIRSPLTSTQSREQGNSQPSRVVIGARSNHRGSSSSSTSAHLAVHSQPHNHQCRCTPHRVVPFDLLQMQSSARAAAVHHNCQRNQHAQVYGAPHVGEAMHPGRCVLRVRPGRAFATSIHNRQISRSNFVFTQYEPVLLSLNLLSALASCQMLGGRTQWAL